MFGQRGVDPRCQVPKCSHLPLDARLGNNVVVLDAVQQLSQAPKRISLNSVQDGLRKLSGVHSRLNVWVGNVQAQEHLPERRHQIINALHIPAGRVPHSPDIQYTLQRPLRCLVTVELNMGVRSRYVDTDLMPYRFVQSPRLAGRRRAGHSLKRLFDSVKVFFSLPFQGRHSPFAISRQIAQQQLPRHRTELFWHTRPCQGS